VNGWTLVATVALGAGVGATVWGVATGPLRRRVVAQNLSTALACPALLLLARGYDRPSYVDLALVLALLGPVGTLVFARLLADELADDPPRAWGLTWAAAGFGAAVVLALCVAEGPSRAMAKLLATGALLIGGNIVASRALSGGFGGVRRG
jgi:multisubunit Na+/H+ antiporter MnhF subunit